MGNSSSSGQLLRGNMLPAITNAILQPFSMTQALGPIREYEELDGSREEIRVTELYPKQFRESTKRKYLSCYTRTASYTDLVNPIQPYAALSYTWGDPKETCPMYLDNRLVRITENLSAALQEFEHDRLALRIWVDAICINQSDETEKSHQVEMMSQIFHKASVVLVWLGSREDGSDEAIDALKQIGQEVLQLRALDRGPNKPSDTSNYRETNEKEVFEIIWAKWCCNCAPMLDLVSIQKVFKRPWFRRVWVLQEAAVNESVTFYCGKKSISKQALWAGARAVIALTNRMSSHSWTTMDDTLIWQTLGGSNFITRRTLRLVAGEEKKFPLETLLAETTANLGECAYEATDPRDRIFGILGFSSDATKLNIHSDYEKPCEVAYTEVAEAILKQSSTLDILYAISGSKNMTAMPSWTPDWSVPIPSTFGLRHMGKFSASGFGTCSLPTFRTDTSGHKLLILSGHTVDSVDTILDKQWDPLWDVRFDDDSPMLGFIKCLKTFAQTHKTLYSSEEERYEALWRTPIADCDAHFSVMGKSRPSASARMRESFQALMEMNQGDLDQREKASKPYIHVMRLESARRRVFITSKGYYGLGQETLRVGDTVCLLFGGDSPFIIREATSGTHKLIGEAYVHGIMQGEYLHTNPLVEKFTFC